MTSGAELSSVATALDELTKRVAGIAEGLSGTERDDVALTLYEVERSLATAQRRLGRVMEQMR
jgi:DNA/RNA-binding domain of Phe-tRNA-synthetase-like protein